MIMCLKSWGIVQKETKEEAIIESSEEAQFVL